MSSATIACPTCHALVSVPSSLAGKSALCPKCKTVIAGCPQPLPTEPMPPAAATKLPRARPVEPPPVQDRPTKKAELEDAYNRYRQSCGVVAQAEASRDCRAAVQAAEATLPLVHAAVTFQRRFLKAD